MRKGLFAVAMVGVVCLGGSVAAKASPVLLGFGTTPSGPFTTFNKNGFTVANAGNDHWQGSGTDGNPAPGLVAGHKVGGTLSDNTASLTISEGGGEFKVLAFQVDNFGKDVNFTLTAYELGVELFSISGDDPVAGWSTIPVPKMYQVYATGYVLTMNIGLLSIGPNAEFGLDNIVVEPTPEPGTLALLATGMLAAVGMGWRRRLA